MSTTPEPSQYQRGVETGGIISRLEGHDKHFDRINGSLDEVAIKLAQLVLAVQRLGDQAVARDATVLTTAAALRAADEARRHAAEQKWSPVAKAITVVGALVALAGLVVTLIVLNSK